VSFQGVLAAVLLQVQALQQAEAANWIQSDLENLRWQTTDLQLPWQPDRCQNNADRDFADALRDRIAQTDVAGTHPYKVPAQIKVSATGQKFDLSRTLYLADANILGIHYQVHTHGTNRSPILNFYAEVLPDAALQCP
jgi:hypothetical protein